MGTSRFEDLLIKDTPAKDTPATQTMSMQNLMVDRQPMEMTREEAGLAPATQPADKKAPVKVTKPGASPDTKAVGWKDRQLVPGLSQPAGAPDVTVVKSPNPNPGTAADVNPQKKSGESGLDFLLGGLKFVAEGVSGVQENFNSALVEGGRKLASWQIEQVKKENGFSTDSQAIAFINQKAQIASTGISLAQDFANVGISDPAAFNKLPYDQQVTWLQDQQKTFDAEAERERQATGNYPSAGMQLTTGDNTVVAANLNRAASPAQKRLQSLKRIADEVIMPNAITATANRMAAGGEYIRQRQPTIFNNVRLGMQKLNPDLKTDEQIITALGNTDSKTLSSVLGEDFTSDMEKKGTELSLKTDMQFLIQNTNLYGAIRAKAEDDFNAALEAWKATPDIREKTALVEKMNTIRNEFRNNEFVINYENNADKYLGDLADYHTIDDKYPIVKARTQAKQFVEEHYKDKDWVSRKVLNTNGLMSSTPSAEQLGAYGIAGQIAKSGADMFLGMYKTANTVMGQVGMKGKDEAFFKNYQVQRDFDAAFYTPEAAQFEQTKFELPESVKTTINDVIAARQLKKEQGASVLEATTNIFGKPVISYNSGGIIDMMSYTVGQIATQAGLSYLGGEVLKDAGLALNAVTATEAGSLVRSGAINLQAATDILGFTGKAGKWLSSGAGAETLGLIGSTYATTWGNNYEQAVNAGLSESEATTYANISSGGTTATEMIYTPMQMMRNIRGLQTIGKPTIRTIADIAANQALTPRSRVWEAMKTFGRAASGGVRGGLAEVWEEGIDQWKTHVLDGAYNINTTNSDVYSDVFNTMYQTAIGMIPMAIVGAYGHSHALRREALYRAGTNVDGIRAYYETAMNNPRNSTKLDQLQKKKDAALQVANTMQEIISGIGDTNAQGRAYTDDEKMVIAEQIFKQRKLAGDAKKVADETQAKPMEDEAAKAKEKAQSIMKGTNPTYIIKTNGDEVGRSVMDREALLDFLASSDYQDHKNLHKIEVYNDPEMQQVVDYYGTDMRPSDDQQNEMLDAQEELMKSVERDRAKLAELEQTQPNGADYKQTAARLRYNEKSLKLMNSVVGTFTKTAPEGADLTMPQSNNEPSGTANVQTVNLSTQIEIPKGFKAAVIQPKARQEQQPQAPQAAASVVQPGQGQPTETTAGGAAVVRPAPRQEPQPQPSRGPAVIMPEQRPEEQPQPEQPQQPAPQPPAGTVAMVFRDDQSIPETIRRGMKMNRNNYSKAANGMITIYVPRELAVKYQEERSSGAVAAETPPAPPVTDVQPEVPQGEPQGQPQPETTPQAQPQPQPQPETTPSRAAMSPAGEFVPIQSQGEGANLPSQEVRNRFNNAPKAVSTIRMEKTLPNEKVIGGYWALVPDTSLTPSHDSKTFKTSKGFPVDEQGRNPNDRNYEIQKNQKAVQDKAEKYNEQALDSMPTVTPDGIVIDGNDRTMAGQIAARNGTDGRYNDQLQKRLGALGFTKAQYDEVAKAGAPRLVFITDQTPHYDTQTFRQFNQSEQKGKTPTERAIEHGRPGVIKEGLLRKIFNEVDSSSETGKEYESLADFFRNNKSVAKVFNALADAKVITRDELSNYMDEKGKISPDGQTFLETLLLGNIVGEDNIPMLAEPQFKQYRETMTTALNGLAASDNLGEAYSLKEPLNEALQIKSAYEAAKQETKGLTLEGFMAQPDFFEAAPSPEALAMLYALEAGPKNFRKFVNDYNDSAQVEAEMAMMGGGMFDEEPSSRNDIIDNLINTLQNERQSKAAKQGATTGQGAATKVEAPPDSKTAKAQPAANSGQAQPAASSAANTGKSTTEQLKTNQNATENREGLQNKEVPEQGNQQQRGNTNTGEQGTGQEKTQQGTDNRNSDQQRQGKAKIEMPSVEQMATDTMLGNYTTFTYNSRSEVPKELERYISSEGTLNGKTTVRVSIPTSLADYLLAQKEAEQQGQTQTKTTAQSAEDARANDPNTVEAAAAKKIDIISAKDEAALKQKENEIADKLRKMKIPTNPLTDMTDHDKLDPNVPPGVSRSMGFAERQNDAALNEMASGLDEYLAGDRTDATVEVNGKQVHLDDKATPPSEMALKREYRRQQQRLSEAEKNIPEMTERGVTAIKTAIAEQVASGKLDPRVEAMANYLMDKNPEMFRKMAISFLLHNDPGALTQGYYHAAQNLVTLFTDKMDSKTLVHEFMHHSEQFMPAEVRDNIINQWRAQVLSEIADAKQQIIDNPGDADGILKSKQKILYLNLALAKMTEPDYNKREQLSDLQDRYLQSIGDSYLYQFYDPSEYWAANATRIFGEEYNKRENPSLWQKAKNFISDLMTSIKRAFGIKNSDPIAQGVEQIMRGNVNAELNYGLFSGREYNYALDQDYLDARLADTRDIVENIIQMGKIKYDEVISFLQSMPNGQSLFPWVHEAYNAIREDPDIFNSPQITKQMSTAKEVEDLSNAMIGGTQSDVMAIGDMYADNVIHDFMAPDAARDEMDLLPISKDKIIQVKNYYDYRMATVKDYMAAAAREPLNALEKGAEIARDAGTSTGLIPSLMKKMRDQKIRNVAAIEREGSYIQRRLLRALKKEYGKRWRFYPAMHQRLDAALRLDPQALAALKPQTQAAIQEMRRYIRNLYENMKRNGLVADVDVARDEWLKVKDDKDVPLAVKRAFEMRYINARTHYQNVGYLYRAYLKNLGKENPNVKDETLRTMAANYINFVSEKQNGTIFSEGEMGNILDSIGKAASDSEFMQAVGHLGNDFAAMLHREDIPEPIRNLMGEINDPTWNFMNTVSAMANLIEGAKANQTLYDLGKGMLFSVDDKANSAKRFTEEITGNWGAVRGKYTTPEIAKAMKEINFLNTGLTRALAAADKWWIGRGWRQAKANFTVLNPAGRIRNWTGNLTFAWRSGALNLLNPDLYRNAKTAWHVFRDATGKLKSQSSEKFFVELTRLGVLNDNVRTQEVQDIVRNMDQLSKQAPNSIGKKRLSRWQQFAEWNRRTRDRLGKTYAAADDFFKVLGFLQTRQRIEDIWGKHGIVLTNQQLNELAAEHVRNGFPTFEKVPRIIKGVSQQGNMVAQYASFGAEVYRTSYQTWANAVKMAFNGANKAEREFGARNLAWAAISMATPSAMRHLVGLIPGFLSAWGQSDDERDAVMAMLPYYVRNNDAHIFALDSGKYVAWLTSGMDGTDVFSNILNGFSRGHGMGKLGEPLWEAVQPFTNTNAFLSGLYKYITNDDGYGHKLYTTNATTTEKMTVLAQQLAAPIVPTAITDAWKILFKPLTNSAIQVYNEKTGSTIEPYKAKEDEQILTLIKVMTGQTLIEIDPELSYKYKMAEFKRKRTAIKQNKKLTPDERYEQFQRYDAEVERYMNTIAPILDKERGADEGAGSSGNYK